ncbi:MAG: hypothetical protein ACPIOQ_84215, partial [Promethearchaeia archaeon]
FIMDAQEPRRMPATPRRSRLPSSGYEGTTGIGDGEPLTEPTTQGERALAQGQVNCIDTPVRHHHTGPRANRSV